MDKQGYVKPFEFCIVLLIIAGILLTLAFSFGGLGQRIRDFIRVSNLKSIAEALEFFYNDTAFYPEWLEGGDINEPNSPLRVLVVQKYLEKPVFKDPSAKKTGKAYYYQTSEDNQNYLLVAELEIDQSQALADCSNPDLRDWSDLFYERCSKQFPKDSLNGEYILKVSRGEVKHIFKEPEPFQKVYATSRLGNLYEFFFDGKKWQNKIICSPGKAVLYGIDLNDGDNDGKDEIYFASHNNHLYQCRKAGEKWLMNDLGKGERPFWDVKVGDADNNGLNEVYGVSEDGLLYQFQPQVNLWKKEKIGDFEGLVYSIGIGDPDNDGQNEIYFGSSQGKIFRYRWTGFTWMRDYLAEAGAWILDLKIYDGDNDGKNEIYTGDFNNHFYQFKWNGLKWQRTKLGQGQDFMHGAVIGDADNNGRDEVYGGNNDGHLYQFRWNGKKWIDKDSGSVEGKIYGLAIGDGDQDKKREIYAATDQGLYQYKWDGKDFKTTFLGGEDLRKVVVGNGDNEKIEPVDK